MNAETNVVANPPVRCAHTEMVDPKLLKQHPSNPNKHGAKQLEYYVAILTAQGWRRAITVSKQSGCITRGHGALQAALIAGWTEVPVDYQDYDSQDLELADVIADNQLQRMSEMDTGKLTQMVVYLKDAGGFDMQLTALPSKKIEKIQEAFNQAHPDQQGADPTAPAALPAAAVATIGSASLPGATPAPVTLGVQLFFNEEAHAEFMRYAQYFQKALHISSPGDAVLEVLRQAFQSESDEGEPAGGDVPE